MGFITFMRSRAGRALRIGAGLALIAAGPAAVDGVAGAAVAAIGLVPLAAGALDLCLFAPLAGLDLRGRPRRPAA